MGTVLPVTSLVLALDYIETDRHAKMNLEDAVAETLACSRHGLLRDVEGSTLSITIPTSVLRSVQRNWDESFYLVLDVTDVVLAHLCYLRRHIELKIRDTWSRQQRVKLERQQATRDVQNECPEWLQEILSRCDSGESVDLDVGADW